MKVNLDPAALTFGDLEAFEDAAGVGLMDTFSKIDKNGTTGLSIKTVMALVWICGRKDNPALTFDDVRAMTFDELEIDVGGNGADPTPGGD